VKERLELGDDNMECWTSYECVEVAESEEAVENEKYVMKLHYSTFGNKKKPLILVHMRLNS
jgi:hypothetical protein